VRCVHADHEKAAGVDSPRVKRQNDAHPARGGRTTVAVRYVQKALHDMFFRPRKGFEHRLDVPGSENLLVGRYHLLGILSHVCNATPMPLAANIVATLRLFGGLVVSFIGGGVFGAVGFSYLGFFWVTPLALLLVLLAMPPLLHDLRRRTSMHARLRRFYNKLRVLD